MSDLKARFEKAVAESKSLPARPDNQTLLKIYALFKQSTEGDNTGKRQDSQTLLVVQNTMHGKALRVRVTIRPCKITST